MSSITCFDGKHRFLSNFHPSPFLNDSTMWPTVEHYFQAMKTTVHNDFLAIRAAGSPGLAKRLGREIVIRQDWEFVRASVMLDAVRMKFEQNEDLAKLLIGTGPVQLIEGNTWHDNIWGNCTCTRNTCMFNKGQNLLGKILMLVREELRL